MISFLTTVHVLICICLILVVLIQSGKGSGIGDIFGGGATQSFMGAGSGKNLLTRITYTLFILFIVTSLTLAIIPKQSGTSRLQQELRKDLMVTPTMVPMQATIEPSAPINNALPKTAPR